jgi:hypothetical protein
MPICETCGNDYDKTFEVLMHGEKHVFDSFECAMRLPRCAHIAVRALSATVSSVVEPSSVASTAPRLKA